MDARRQAVEAARQTAWNVDRETVEGDHEVAPYIRTARRLRRLGAFGRAVEVIDAAVAPTAIRKNPQALIDRALAHYGCGHVEQALADLETALKFLDAEEAPHQDEAPRDRLRCHVHLNRASILRLQGHQEESLEAAEAAWKAAPDRWEAGCCLAIAREVADKTAAAEDAVRAMAMNAADRPEDERRRIVAYMRRHADLDALRRRIDVDALFGLGSGREGGA